jgi:FixJ family two-component response regulator
LIVGTDLALMTPMNPCLGVAMLPAHELRAELSRFEERVIRQRDASVMLTSRQVADCDELPRVLRSILEVSAATLGVDRASMLPGMSGRELAERALEPCPGVPVLYTSGHTDDRVLAHGIGQNLVHFIAKPYTVSALTDKIRDVLTQSRAGGRKP